MDSPTPSWILYAVWYGSHVLFSSSLHHQESIAADAYFFSSRQVLSAVDELRMSVSRFRLKTREEELAEAAARRLAGGGSAAALSSHLADGYAISVGEVEPMQAQLVIELGLATAALERSHLQHRYLKNLREEEEKKFERRKPPSGDCGEWGGEANCAASCRTSKAQGPVESEETRQVSPHTTSSGEGEEPLPKRDRSRVSSKGDDLHPAEGLNVAGENGSLGTEGKHGGLLVPTEERSDTLAPTAPSREAQGENKGTAPTPDKENPVSTPRSSSSVSSAPGSEVGATASSRAAVEVSEQGTERECTENKEDDRAACVGDDLLPVTVQKGEQGKPSTVCIGSPAGRGALSVCGDRDAPPSLDRSADSRGLQAEAQKEEKKKPQGEEDDREEKRVCPVCFTELGGNSCTAVLPCAHQLCVECSKAVRTEKISEWSVRCLATSICGHL